jgi:serine/threonine-protein kinase HipA
VLTAQPSLDAGQMQRKKFKLAMSVGKSRHYPVLDILPRHFMQTADIAGVGKPLMGAIFDDLSANALNQADGVINALPKGYSEPLVESVRSAIAARTSILANTKDDA